MIKRFSIILGFFLLTIFFAPSAQAVCNCGPTNPDYGDSSDKTAWCACAVDQCKDFASGVAGGCSQLSCSNTTYVPTRVTCGQVTYAENCNNDTRCNASGATADTTFSCSSSKNPNCTTSTYKCNSCAPAPAPQKVCEPNQVYGMPECRKCGPLGTFPDAKGTWYPAPESSAEWCSCAKQYSSQSQYQEKCERGSTPTPPATTTDDGSTCEYKILDPKTRKTTYVISGQEYLLQVTTKNVGKTTWKANAYKLAFSDKSKSDWGAADVVLGRDIDPNETEIFDLKVKGPQTPAGEHSRASFYAQLNSGSAGFGAACEPIDIDITPPFSGTGPTSTLCYVISEDLAEVNRITKCDFNDPLVRPYTQNPQTLNYIYKDTTPGLKNLYVKFFDNNNKASNEGIPYTKTVLLSPIPRITTIDCRFTPNEIGTTVTVNGENFATQGRGTVKVGDQQSQIVSWNNTAINATVGQRLETSARVSVTFDDGKTLSDTCLVNTTTFTFTAKNQCAKDNDFSASNVDVRIYENGTDPIIKQVIKLDKEGKPTGFAPKLEKGKKYTMIIKSPGTLAKKVEINTGSGGTTIVDPFAVNVGDIYPRNTMDGKVNNLDVSELKRQWSPTKDTEASGDLNSDKRVNNVDWSCMRININKEDEAFTPSAASTGTGSTSGNRSFGVKGKVFIDTDQDGTQDVSEPSIPGITVKALRQASPEVPGQNLTSVQAGQAILLGQTVTDSSGNYSINLVPPSSILNLVMWVDPSVSAGQGGQSAIGIGALTDEGLRQFPLVMDIKLKP